MRYEVLPKRDSLGFLKVRDVVDGRILPNKFKTVKAVAEFIVAQQDTFEWVCRQVGVSVTEGMKMSNAELRKLYEEREVE